MSKLNQVVFHNTLRKKEVWVYLAFTLLPLLVFVTELTDTKFLRLTGDFSEMNFLDFYGTTLGIIDGMILPAIVIAYIASTMFYGEINKGILFLYKDINRKKVMNSKVFSLMKTYGVYLLLVMLSSLVIYYFFVIQMKGGTFSLLGSVTPVTYYSMLGVLGLFGIDIVAILVAANLSVRFSTGVTVLGTIFFLFLMQAISRVDGLNYLSPMSYRELFNVGQMTFSMSFMLLVFLCVVYVVSAYTLLYRQFSKVEY